MWLERLVCYLNLARFIFPSPHLRSPPTLSPYRARINLRLVVLWASEVLKVGENKLELFLLLLRLQPEDGRDEGGEAKQFGYDRIPPADQFQEGLPTSVLFCKEVQSHDRWMEERWAGLLIT